MALISRRRLLAGAAGVTVTPRHHKRRRRMGMQPDQSGVFFQVVVIGPGAQGVFLYDASGNLVDSMAVNANVDPLTASNDPGITSYLPGLQFANLFDGSLALGSLNPSTLVHFAGAVQFDDATAAATQPDIRLLSPETVAGTRVTVWVLGSSNDNSKPPQVVINQSATPTPRSSALLEVQGSAAIVSPAGVGLVFLIPSGVAATDTAAVAAVLNLGSTPVLCPGTWNINCGDATLTALGPGQWIIGCGDLNTIINAHGSGDVFRWFHTGSISDGTTTGGGFIGGGTIDGSACSGAATGIHAGDINALRFDVRCQHFNQTGGSWGFFFENRNFFTERMHINIRAKDCGFAGSDGGMVGFNVGGATTSTGSFARLKGRIEITQGSNQQDGVVLEGGAHIYDYDLEIVGNFQAGASATTAAALRLTGTVPVGHPGAGTHSAISNGRLNIGLECSSGANAPTDFVQASTSNSITDSYGNINWNQNFTSSGITGAGFKFGGLVQGDTAMGTRLYYGTAPTQTIIANGQTISSTVPSAKIPISAGGAGFTGAILSPGDVDGQLIYLIGTGSVGANVTFAVAGTSNVANGTSAVIIPNTMMALMWDAASALWYPAS